jgi:hypothetical protein
MDLSILIATVPQRKIHLNRLLYTLQNQIVGNNLQDKIEVIVYKDNFEKSLGEKRNILIQESLGKYVVSIDDDDMVSEDYCKNICDTIKNYDVDQISITKRWYEDNKSMPIKISKKFGYYSIRFLKFLFLEEIINKGGNPIINLKVNKKIIISNKNFLSSFFIYFLFFVFKKYVTNGLTYTHPMTPIKKEIAGKIKFSDRPRDQDVEWICEMYKSDLIKSEYIIDKELYYYYFNKKTSINKKSNQQIIDWEPRLINKIKIKWI